MSEFLGIKGNMLKSSKVQTGRVGARVGKEVQSDLFKFCNKFNLT